MIQVVLLTCFLVIAAIVLLIAYICYRMAFYAAPRPAVKSDAIDIPEGEIYEAFREKMEKWALATRALPQEDVTVTSFDGLRLHGTYYEFAPGAPIELMFHGYRGSAERDLAGGVQRCFKLGRSALLVDQRCSGRSEGKTITFGINEHRDCLTWLEFMGRRFGPDVKIILTGISMGASTVMMAADKELPPNVIGILADCGFNSARDIIKKVITQMGLPAGISYPFVKLGARLFGRFDLEESSAQEALKNARVPVIFFHGEADDFVPCDMSRRCHEANRNMTRFVSIPGAGHGLSYLVDKETYLKVLREFWNL